MSYKLKQIIEPAVEPVTVAEVKIHAHIDHAIEDDLIAEWIKAAREAAQDFQWRSYYTQQWELSFDEWPATPFDIPMPPLVAVDSLKYYDTDDTEYEFDLNDLLIDTDSTPGRITLAYGETWPSTTLRSINAIKLRYIAGYGTNEDLTTTADSVLSAIPSCVKDAIYVYCTWRNENRAGETDIPKQFYDILRKTKVS